MNNNKDDSHSPLALKSQIAVYFRSSCGHPNQNGLRSLKDFVSKVVDDEVRSEVAQEN